ncbi:hypothetical protein F4809DRAFT_286111 [Biscogniauxia mediterranea]|nr:hypothetical protein F4809DRAFT_286111 [Biscogniauxia mediterranea]
MYSARPQLGYFFRCMMELLARIWCAVLVSLGPASSSNTSSLSEPTAAWAAFNSSMSCILFFSVSAVDLVREQQRRELDDEVQLIEGCDVRGQGESFELEVRRDIWRGWISVSCKALYTVDCPSGEVEGRGEDNLGLRIDRIETRRDTFKT